MTGIVGRFMLLLSLVSLGSGCSFVFVEPVPSYHRNLPPQEPVECTSARAAPMLDTIVAAVSLTAAAAAAAADDEEYEDESVNRRENVTANLLVAAVATSSAIYGYVTVKECRDAKAERAEALRRDWLRGRPPYGNRHTPPPVDFAPRPRWRGPVAPPHEPPRKPPAPEYQRGPRPPESNVPPTPDEHEPL